MCVYVWVRNKHGCTTHWGNIYIWGYGVPMGVSRTPHTIVICFPELMVFVDRSSPVDFPLSLTAPDHSDPLQIVIAIHKLAITDHYRTYHNPTNLYRMPLTNTDPYNNPELTTTILYRSLLITTDHY